MAPDPDQASTALAAIRAVEQAADPAPWTISARHGVDIADEGWSEVSIVTGDGAPVALTFLSHVLEPGRDEENAAFIVTARTAMPRLLVAVERVLELHARQDKPVRSWDLDLRCAAHDWTRNTIRSFDAVRDCPDCRYSEYYACSHCRCPDDAWPCPTVRAITAALTGQEAGDGLETRP